MIMNICLNSDKVLYGLMYRHQVSTPQGEVWGQTGLPPAPPVCQEVWEQTEPKLGVITVNGHTYACLTT